MGGKCPHRKVKKRRLSHKTARRTKFQLKGDDAVYDELLKLAEEKEAKPLPPDEDLPGLGQFYCLHCDRYFASEGVMDEHFRSKRHKKRLDLLYIGGSLVVCGALSGCGWELEKRMLKGRVTVLLCICPLGGTTMVYSRLLSCKH
ncbi:zinc finger C2H2 protein ECU02_0310 isoform X1 [Typha latifolia]|uniref:zinc finger C2H2 protein ECU02_0310 isoform X1 n=1 Tax=Typha latifolia TaxID=4733 RepID=UPI003C2D90BC